MKLRAKLVYVRDHDLQQGDKGLQKVLQFQTPGGSDIRLTLLTHTGEHEGHPTPTIEKKRADMTDPELGALLTAGKAKTYVANDHQPPTQRYEMVRIAGDEGKEFEITITPV